MLTVITVIYVFIVIALVGVILLQRSEGGALGIGGGGAGGFMSGRGAANALTKATSVLGALFFVFSLGLSIFGEKPETAADISRELTGGQGLDINPVEGEINADSLLDSLGDLEQPTVDSVDDLNALPDAETPTEEEDDDPSSDDDTQQ